MWWSSFLYYFWSNGISGVVDRDIFISMFILSIKFSSFQEFANQATITTLLSVFSHFSPWHQLSSLSIHVSIPHFYFSLSQFGHSKYIETHTISAISLSISIMDIYSHSHLLSLSLLLFISLSFISQSLHLSKYIGVLILFPLILFRSSLFLYFQCL